MNFLTIKEKILLKNFVSKGYVINNTNNKSFTYIENLYQKVLKKIFKTIKKININLLNKY